MLVGNGKFKDAVLDVLTHYALLGVEPSMFSRDAANTNRELERITLLYGPSGNTQMTSNTPKSFRSFQEKERAVMNLSRMISTATGLPLFTPRMFLPVARIASGKPKICKKCDGYM
jgi:hypothetical protein